MTAPFICSWRYFDAAHNQFHVLTLAFLGAMGGPCLTGDIFDMFVFFELMGVAAFALTAYTIEEQGQLQGALNFGVINMPHGYAPGCGRRLPALPALSSCLARSAG